jgi:glycogen debranching enzyme
MFETTPTSIEQCQARYAMVLKPGAEVTIGWSLRCEPLWKHRIASFEVTEAEARTASAQAWAECCRVESDNEHLEDWLESALRDVLMLTTRTPLGDYPCAGVPWYSVPFGRDGIISALQMLWVAPGLARGVLAYLAAHQSSERDPARDAEPGKILHERRQDEMANTGEVPFGRYYGSVDATPLFVILAGAYYVETGDAAALRELWPHVRRALDWIDRHGDLDGDGFVEYPGRSSHGLVNQGWKDSHDSVFHADGSSPEGPIALCEVQAYVIAAKQHAAAMAVALGIPEEAAHLARESEELRTRFEQAFWVEDIGCYALALDGAKRPCAVRTSNAGHVLFCGVASPERAARTMATLTAPAMHSGWGIRTVAMGEARYNPMSYHNGSVWPHDNAMIAAGFAHYGLRDACGSLLRTWLEASVFMDRARLPELCCGFERRSGQGPTLYPVACSPQAWSAGAPYMMLASCLGLRVAGARAQVRVVRPYLPESIDQVTIRGLRVGAGKVDLRIRREGSGVSVLTLAKDSDVEVVSLQ